MENLSSKLIELFTQEELLNLSGDIISSDSDLTLKKGKYYFLGFNPGGEANINITLKHAIENLYGQGNLYLTPYAPNVEKNYLTPLQRRYSYLWDELGEYKNTIFSTNLIFHPSRESKLVNYFDEAKACWKLHKEFLKIVKPEIILCNGNGQCSSFSYIYQILGLNSPIDEVLANHGNWKIKCFSGKFNNKELLVIGIPHMSYYHPKNGIGYLKKIISNSINQNT